jgi:hypothetical protein
MYMFTNCEQPPYLQGGFAEYCYVLPNSGRIKVPDAVPSALASAASGARHTVVHGFDRVVSPPLAKSLRNFYPCAYHVATSGRGQKDTWHEQAQATSWHRPARSASIRSWT